MAAAVLAGVNPIHGLYAVMLSTPVGALFTSSAFMSVQTTSAMSLLVASTAAVQAGENAMQALFLLAVLTGIFMLALGLLKMGWLTRFVPNSVMVGFINLAVGGATRWRKPSIPSSSGTRSICPP
jgi:SulP family sulfate permease